MLNSNLGGPKRPDRDALNQHDDSREIMIWNSIQNVNQSVYCRLPKLGSKWRSKEIQLSSTDKPFWTARITIHARTVREASSHWTLHCKNEIDEPPTQLEQLPSATTNWLEKLDSYHIVSTKWRSRDFIRAEALLQRRKLLMAKYSTFLQLISRNLNLPNLCNDEDKDSYFYFGKDTVPSSRASTSHNLVRVPCHPS